MTDSADGDLTVVLVHGGFLGPWIWADVVRELSRDGLRPVCVDLPSCRGTGTKLAGLADDVQAVRAALDGCARAVVCGTRTRAWWSPRLPPGIPRCGI